MSYFQDVARAKKRPMSDQELEEWQLKEAIRLSLEDTPPPLKKPRVESGKGWIFPTCGPYNGHWEKQKGAQCGLHALRAITWTKQLERKDMNKFFAVTKKGIQKWNKGTCEWSNADPIVNTMALFNLSHTRIDNKPWEIENDMANPPKNLRGYIINIPDPIPHWFAIRRGIGQGCYYNLDSYARDAKTAIKKKDVIDIVLGRNGKVKPKAIYKVTANIKGNKYDFPNMDEVDRGIDNSLTEEDLIYDSPNQAFYHDEDLEEAIRRSMQDK